MLSLATFRLTRLLAQDMFPPLVTARRWVENRWGLDSWEAYLVHCMWCMSIYVAGAVTLGADRLLERGVPAPVLVWLAASTITGYLATLEPG